MTISRPSKCLAVLTLCSFAALTGCMTAEEQAAADRQTCSSYGYTQGSTAFANCMMASDQQRKKAVADWQAEEQKKWDQKANPVTQECETTEKVDSTSDGQSSQTNTKTVCIGQ